MGGELEKDSITLMGFAMITSVVNYLFQITSARVVNVEDYGTLSVIMATMFVLQVSGQSCQLLVAKNISEYCVINDSKGATRVVKRYIKLSLMVATAYLIVGSLLIPFYNQLMNVSNITYTVLMLLTVAMTFGQYLTMGIAQGLRQFIIMPVIGLVVAITKLFGIGLGWLIFEQSNQRMLVIMMFLLIGTGFGTVFGSLTLFSNKSFIKKISIKEVISSEGVSKTEFGEVFVLNLSIVFMMYIDVFLVRIHSSNYLSGLYSSSAQFGKILIFALLALINAFLPQIANVKASKKSTLKLYYKVLTYTCMFIGVGFIPVLLFPDLLVRILMGEKYIDAAVFIKYSYMIALSIVLNMLNMNYLVAIGKVKLGLITYVLGAVICLMVGTLFSMNITRIAISIFTVSTLVFSINFVYIIKCKKEEGGICQTS